MNGPWLKVILSLALDPQGIYIYVNHIYIYDTYNKIRPITVSKKKHPPVSNHPIVLRVTYCISNHRHSAREKDASLL